MDAAFDPSKDKLLACNLLLSQSGSQSVSAVEMLSSTVACNTAQDMIDLTTVSPFRFVREYVLYLHAVKFNCKSHKRDECPRLWIMFRTSQTQSSALTIPRLQYQSTIISSNHTSPIIYIRYLHNGSQVS